MNEYYAHTIRLSNFNKIDLERIEKILKKGYILSRRKLLLLGEDEIDIREETSTFNGMDYISLCDLKKEHHDYSAYNMYTKNGLSLLLSRDIPVIMPNLVEKSNRLDSIFNMHKLGKGENRYSDLEDEVQVKDSISLEYLKGLCFSIKKLLSFCDEDYLYYYIEVLNFLLYKYHYPVPIYNIDDNTEIKSKLLKIR